MQDQMNIQKSQGLIDYRHKHGGALATERSDWHVLVRNSSGTLASAQSRKWMTDASYDSCFGCMRKFNMFHRRHHCRLCGQLFCKSCSNHRVELSTEQGYVRSCDSCFLKQKNRSQRAASVLFFPMQPTSSHLPTPFSMFALAGSDARIAVSIDHHASETAMCRLSPTLSCRCYENMKARHAIQSAHFDLSDSRRLRVELQFQSTGSVLFSVRMQTKTAVYVGAAAAGIQVVPRFGFRIVDDFRMQLSNVDNNEHRTLAGSLAWKLPDAVASFADDPVGNREDREKLRCVVDSEISEMNQSLSNHQLQEKVRRQALNVRQQEVEAAKLRSVPVSAVSTSPVPPPGPNLQPHESLEILRQRRSSQWEAIEDLLSERNKIAVRVEHLRLLHECLKKVQGVDHEADGSAPFSCMCFRCLGTIVV